MTDRPSDAFAAVVVAAGTSSRFGGERPKQFEDLGSGSVLERAVRCVADCPAVQSVVVVLAPEEAAGPRGHDARGWPSVSAVVAGGETRADSVRRGLSAVTGVGHVLVHDAARPLASVELIERVVRATLRDGAAIPAIDVPDTVKRVADDRVEATEDRSVLRLAQTPQGSRLDWLREALDRTRGETDVTDEASALELAGRPVAVVAGDPLNRKITTRADLEQARRTLEGDSVELRVGTGFDVHRRVAGRRLVLGGVSFEGEDGLEGHSDADVVLHAAMDAVLGGAALGDIGMMFPPEDAEWAGADSRRLAERVAARLAEAGFEIVNLDLTLLAERPKIRHRSDEMRLAIAACFGIPVERVGLKATTLERLGALGRGEGIACQASAMVRRRP